MIILLGNIVIMLFVILLIILNVEFKIKENEQNKILYEENTKKKEKENVYKTSLINYVKNTKDQEILKDGVINNLNTDTSFINPNLSIKDARSNFIVNPIDFDIGGKCKNNKLTNKFEKSILKKTK